MSAYHVGDARNLIKLDAMENPYPWPEEIRREWLASLHDCPLNRYPDPEAAELVMELRRNDGVPDAAAMLLGNGSDEIIQLLMMALPPEAAVLAPEPGFVMYKQVARSLGLDYLGVPLQADGFGLDLAGMLAAIELRQPALVFLAYPNNPTGNLFDAAAMRSILDRAPGLVVVDEAYAPFAQASFIGELAARENLLVMRTLSKLGLAGLRLGYLLGSPAILAELHKIRLPYNINCLTQATAAFALRNAGFLYRQTQLICEQRHLLAQALMARSDIQVYPSSANFLLFKTLAMPATAVFEALKKQGVLIRNLSPQGGLLADCLRVTIGTPAENQAFLQALEQALTGG